MTISTTESMSTTSAPLTGMELLPLPISTPTRANSYPPPSPSLHPSSLHSLHPSTISLPLLTNTNSMATDATDGDANTAEARSNTPSKPTYNLETLGLVKPSKRSSKIPTAGPAIPSTATGAAAHDGASISSSQRSKRTPPTVRESLKAIYRASWLNVLVVFVPISWALHFALPATDSNDTVIFVSGYLFLLLTAFPCLFHPPFFRAGRGWVERGKEGY